MENILIENAYSESLRKSYQSIVANIELREGVFKDTLEIKQKALTDSLDKLIPHGLFYFAYDIKKDEIVKSGGIEEWLGILKVDFKRHVYNNLFHPVLKASQGLYGRGLVTALNRNISGLELDIETTYLNYTQTLVKKIDSSKSKYWFVKRTLVPYIYTEENNLLGWINIFNIINEYEIYPFKFQNSSFGENYEKIQSITTELITKQEQMRALNNIFKKDETHIQILNLYIKLEHKSKHKSTAATIGKILFNNHELAWSLFQKRFKSEEAATKFIDNKKAAILQIARDWGLEFKEAKDFAYFLETLYLLPIKDI